MNEQGKIEIATFGGGCFWCLQPPFDKEPGVVSTHVGYMGDSADNAAYSLVASGTTKHVEVLQLEFDPAQVSYERLLEIYWRNINPVQNDGQFADRGPQYQTVIFAHSPDQESLARRSKQELEQSGKFSQPIAVEIRAASEFFAAEENHQRYYQKNSLHYEMYKQGSGRADYIKNTWDEAD